MRNAQQEDAFIEAFIVSERRERYRFMLANTTRRRQFLDRLNHMLDFIPSLAQQIPGNLHNPAGVARLLNERGVQDSDAVYVFSDVKELDGQSLSMLQAVERVLEFDWGSVVCCAPGKLAYYRPEAPENGYILEKPA